MQTQFSKLLRIFSLTVYMHTYIPMHTGKTNLPESQPHVLTVTQADNISSYKSV